MKNFKVLFTLLFTVLLAGCDPETEAEEAFVATQDIEVQVDYFSHRYDLETMKEEVSYKITYKNPNGFPVLGSGSKTIKITTKTGEVISKEIGIVGRTACERIGAGEMCIDELTSIVDLDPNLFDPNDIPVITLVKVEYTIREELR